MVAFYPPVSAYGRVPFEPHRSPHTQMSPTAWFLYAVTVLIWGSTWLGITFQLGKVDPLVSVIYRFALATLALFAWCRFKRAPLALSLREHVWIALQGSCLFALNYWLIYHAELYLTSGIVAVLFATLSFMNMLNGRIFFGRALSARMAGGALFGVAGVGILFWPEVQHLSLEDRAVKGAMLALASTYIASLGNVVAGHNARFRWPVITGNAWGMFYGTLLLLGIALVKGVDFHYPTELSYTLSLMYLALFGSVFAFGAYLRLIALIGPDRAGYSSTVTPVVALLMSTAFEGYHWGTPAIAGLLLILIGNVLVLRGRR